MSDLTHLFGGGPFLAYDSTLPSPEEQLKQQMILEGFIPPSTIVFNGVVQRFPTNGKPSDDAGWLIAFDEEIPYGAFGDWRTDSHYHFSADIGRKLTLSEHVAMTARMDEVKIQHEADKKALYAEAALKAVKIWEESELADHEHPYLVRKGIGPNGIRKTKDGRLVLPLYDADGMMATVQYINDDGKKLYLTGGATGGCGWMLGNLNNAPKVYLAEGFATAASIFEETGRPVGIAYSAGNLPAMAQILRLYAPEANIIIVADNDFPNKNTGVTIGLAKATEAAKLTGCNVVMPPEVGHDANDFRLAGGSLKELLGEGKQYMTFIDDMTGVPSPVSWLVKGWVQDKAMVMLHGPSGCGKSFVALDWMCSIASGQGQWLGKTTKTGDVIYLCGEGHHGLRARAKAWKINHNVSHIGNLVVSNGASDLDKLGDLSQVVENIVDTGVKPKMIVIDTLNRFMSGDENSAKDTRAFLDACSQLMLRFGCTVLIVHHTGLNQDAQGRARGSSAWRGAMDIEISVRPISDGLILEQTKSKDAEPADPLSLELMSVELPGWFDEDGEQVSSAVVIDGAVVCEKVPKQVSSDVRELEEGWRGTGCKLEDGLPFIFRNEWRNYLTDVGGKSIGSANQMLKNTDNRLVGRLTAEKIIEQSVLGVKVIDGMTTTMMLLSMGNG